jgi:protein tyrosine/serine phosphatase
MTQRALDPREVVLDGSVNFRDLGGLTGLDGRTVRKGRIFRSDALHALTEVDLDRLAGLHISTLIDLRSNVEIARSGPSPLLGVGTRVMHCPLMDETGANETLDPDLPMEHLYARMLAGGQGRFGAIFDALGDETTLPAVVHCAAGKDRTGITIALLLRVLGVADEEIVLDYAITDRNMARLIERILPNGVDETRGKIPEHYMRARPETMLAFLATLDERYGSAEAFLQSAGVSRERIESIREHFLDPVD